MPPYTRSGVPPHSPRVLRTSLTDDFTARPETIDGLKIASEFLAAIENGRGDEHLPFATFVIDQDQTIRFRFIGPDFTLRADPARLVSVVTEISIAAEARSSKSTSSPA